MTWKPVFLVVPFVAFAISCTRSAPERSRTRTTEADTRQSPVSESLELFRPPREEKPQERKGQDAPPPVRPDPEPQREKLLAQDTSRDWSVVAATLNSVEAAERRASGLRDQWKDCSCTVFPKGESAHYFVVVGTNLTRASADQLRDRATAAGLPGDTYVTKLIAHQD